MNRPNISVEYRLHCRPDGQPSTVIPAVGSAHDANRGPKREAAEDNTARFRHHALGAVSYAQLVTDAEDEDIAAYAAGHEGGLTGYLGELLLYCRKQLSEAEARPHILAVAVQIRSKRLVLPPAALELLARYQTTLDNQLFKLLRALREAQEWRLKTLEPADDGATEPDPVAAAA